MTEINFYVSSSSSVNSIYKLLPPLLTKIIQQKHKVLIACKDQQQMQSLDKFLWEFDKDEFLPHGTNLQENATEQPILITDESQNLNLADILICLSGKQVNDFSSYLKVFDLFEGTEQQKQQGRIRWKEYKDKGYELSYYTSVNGKWTKQA